MSHFGSIHNNTQEARLYKILKKRPGEWIDVWTLIHAIPAAAVHTVVYGLKQQLPTGETIENKTFWRESVRRRESWYRLVVT